MKTLVRALCLLAYVSSYAQTLPVADDKVIFSQVVQLDTALKSNVILAAAKEWFSTEVKLFNRSNSDKNFKRGDVLAGTERGNSTQLDQLHKVTQPLRLFEPADNKVIGGGVLKYSGSSMGCLRIMYLSYGVRIIAKDGRYKIEVSNFNYDHYNQMSMKSSQLYGMKDEGPCSSKNEIEELLKCEKCNKDLPKFYTYLNEDMTALMGSFKTFVEANGKKKDDF